jgi:hypothetical protein
MKRTALAALAFLFTIATARALEAPVMKEGLWKVHNVTTDGPGTKPEEDSFSICRNHAYDKEAEALANDVMKGCSVNSQTRLGNKITANAVCKVGETTITTKSVTTVSGDTAFHSEASTTYSPAFYGKSQGTTVTDQTYTGSCPAGLEPGDRILSDGTIQRH